MALTRTDIDEDDWSNVDALESAVPVGSSSSAYINPLKSLVTGIGVDGYSNNDRGKIVTGVSDTCTFSYFSESAFGSGLIVPVRYRKLLAKGGAEEGGNRTYLDGDDDESEEHDSKPLLVSNVPMKSGIDNTVIINGTNYVDCCFIFVQGLLAGFAVIISFATISLNGATHPDFLTSYSRVAGQMRRLLYILSTISFVGGLDRLISMVSQRVEGAEEYGLRVTKITIAATSSVMYCVVFVITVILSRTDTLLTLQYGLNDDGSKWYKKALADSEITGQLESWNIGDRVRLVCCLLGWVSCCGSIYLEYVSRELSTLRKQETERIVNMWKWKVDELQGSAHVFEQVAQIPGNDKSKLSMAVSALRKLIAVQQMGVDRAKEALRATLDRLN